MRIIISAVFLSAALSYLISRLLLVLGDKIFTIDIPNERSSHAVPTPRGGGIGIVISIMISLIYLCCLHVITIDKKYLFMIIGLMLIALTGYASDRFDLSVCARLVMQVIISLGVVITIGAIRFPIVENISLIGTVMTVIWLAGIANIYNFMDGIDALAAMQGIILGIGIALLGFITNNQNIIFYGIVLACAVFGFLVLNITPSKIFMGDTGSYAIGFYAAIIPLIDNRLLMPVIIILGTFLFDTIVTLFRRIYTGESLFEAHRNHFYQRAVRLGYSHMQISKSISIVSALFALLAAAYLAGSYEIRFLIIIFCLVILTGLALWVSKAEKRKNIRSF